MRTLDWICICIAAASVAAALIIVFSYRRRTRETLGKISEMLDHAIDGSFTEGIFDESALSAAEAKLERFLSICAVSSKNLQTEKDKIKGLISDISHQTKTPIANILLYSQLLSEHSLPEDLDVCVKALSAQAEKLNFLISSLVKMSRLETGIITVSPKPAPVQPLLESALEQTLPKAESKGVALSVENSEANAYFDMKWTAEALFNILDNAVKYTPGGGEISLNATPYELFCRIDITDNGIGIPEDDQSRIFARFFRSQDVSDQEGVGIGLFLAREIIAAEGGYIKVSSKPGKGSVFSVFLPMER